MRLLLRLAIVGSRELTVKQAVDAVGIIFDYCRHLRPSLIVSGGAKGIDGIAEVCAAWLDIPTEIHLPDGNTWPAYKTRNLQIVNSCDRLLCIRSGQSTSYGAGWTADQMEIRGFPVYREVL